MDLVQTLSEISANIQTLDDYLTKKREPEYSYALALVKRGTCFIAVKSGQSYKFYPSRFVGYAGNTMKNHQNSTEKDGKETNPAISSILHENVSYDPELERAYKEYCESLGFTPNEKGTFGVQRKYWRFNQ